MARPAGKRASKLAIEIGGRRGEPKRKGRAGFLLALTTLPDQGAAKRLARMLVGERLCACVNIVPGLHSIYRWKGRVCIDEEVLLVLKTSAAKGARLQARLLELHPYDVPELIAWPLSQVAPAYARWLSEATS
jgi:periplasmic divalent cation tolerance protein